MRRRPSSSGEDEAASVSLANGASDKPEKSREAMRDGGRPAARQPARSSDRKQGRDMDLSSSHTHAPTSSWPRTSVSNPAPPHPPLKTDVCAKETPLPAAEHKGAQRNRRRSLWSCSPLTLATTAGSIVLLLIIVRSFLTLQLDPKGCAMSYMMPAFAHFSDFDTEHTRFASKYSLYFYREGGVDEDTRVKGIPVLFIPGNAGSYKQVRPIAAEAAHYFQDVLREDSLAIGSGKRPLDFFTVDFNEELTAFHGQTLLDQAEYLNEAVAYILALYHNPHRSLRESGLPDPKSVIILGHSMGGVVARTMLRMPNYQDKSINTIITLSAPHARPPVSFDSAMVATYDDINSFWRQSYSATSSSKNPLADLTLVSVAGGGLDTMIPSEFSSLTSLVPDTHGFTVFTSAIPRVWTGMDHLAIMWCDQFRKALVKAIFDIVDVRAPSQTLPQPRRIQALRKRLLTGMESVVQKVAFDQEPTTFLNLESSSTSVTAHGERLALRTLGGSKKVKAHVMPIPAQSLGEGGKFTLLTDQILNSGDDNGTLAALLCTVVPSPSGVTALALTFKVYEAGGFPGSTRLACKNAAVDVSLLPASTERSVNAFDDVPPFSYLQYEIADLADYQFIAVVDRAAESTPGWIIAEFRSSAESAIKVSKGHHQLLVNGLQLNLAPDRPMMTELKIPEVHSTLFAYRLGVQRSLRDKCEERFAPLLRQSIQEPYESKYFVNTRGGNINVHGISPYMPPPLSGGDASDGLSLQLWTDPTCHSTVHVSLTVDILGSAGKLVMRYRTAFAAFPLLVVAIVLRKQFKVYDNTGVFMSFSQSMDQCIRTSLPTIFAALTFLAISLSKADSSPWPRDLLGGEAENAVDFTTNDLMLGTSDPFFWFLVPLFGVVSVGICIAANYLVLTFTHVLAFVYARVRAWTVRSDDNRKASGPFAATTLRQRIVTSAVLLLMVVSIIPYQFAYIVLCVVQLATAVRALRVARDQNAGPGHCFYNYAHSMLVLMFGILPINMPVTVVWIHNLAVHWLTPFSPFHNLLSILPYILLVETMSTGNMIPRVTSRVSYVTNILIFVFALYAAVYGVTYAYRLHHLVNALCAWLFVIHLSNGPLSLARLARITFVNRGKGSWGRNVKKRP